MKREIIAALKGVAYAKQACTEQMTKLRAMNRQNRWSAWWWGGNMAGSLTSVEPEHQGPARRVAAGLREPVEERPAALLAHRHVPGVLRERHRRLPRQRRDAVRARPLRALLLAGGSGCGRHAADH
jgi:hypothetical protein